MTNATKGLFLDRDGIINERIVGGYVTTPEELVILDTILPVITWAFKHNFIVAVITNQQGVGKGLMTLEDLDLVHATLNRELFEKIGRTVSSIYECTSLASDNDERRKPQPGMLLEAMEDFALLPENCCMVGDSITDAMAGAAAGVRTILVGDFSDDAADKVVQSNGQIIEALEELLG